MVLRWCIAVALSVVVAACPFLCCGESASAQAGQPPCACCAHDQHEEDESSGSSQERERRRDACDCFCQGAVMPQQERWQNILIDQALLVQPVVEAVEIHAAVPRPIAERFSPSAFPPLATGRLVRALISSLVI